MESGLDIFMPPFGRLDSRRRISATYKDLPGGQLLGPTFDYTHRLLDFKMLADGELPEPETAPFEEDEVVPRVTDMLHQDGMLEEDGELDPEAPVGDLTREPLKFPAARDLRLQNLARLPWISMDELIAPVDYANWSNRKQAMFYAESWALGRIGAAHSNVSQSTFAQHVL